MIKRNSWGGPVATLYVGQDVWFIDNMKIKQTYIENCATNLAWGEAHYYIYGVQAYRLREHLYGTREDAVEALIHQLDSLRSAALDIT